MTRNCTVYINYIHDYNNLKKNSGMALIQLSLILHYSRRKFYYQNNIHIKSLFSMLCSSMNYRLLYLSSVAITFLFKRDRRIYQKEKDFYYQEKRPKSHMKDLVTSLITFLFFIKKQNGSHHHEKREVGYSKINV